MAPARREWLTRGEVQGVVHEEMRDALREQNAILERQNVVLDKIADGAQAQILSANILHGNTDLGLEGKLPELTRRLLAVETKLDSTCHEVLDQGAKVEEHHQENLKRFEKLENGQGVILSRMRRMFNWATETGEDGKPKRKWLAALAGAAGTGVVTYVATHTHWEWLKKVLDAK